MEKSDVTNASQSKGNPLFDDFEAKLFDDRVCEHLFGDTLRLRLRIFAGETVEIQNEEFALADILNRAVAEAGQSVLNGLTLRIKDGALGHDPYVCLHAEIIALRRKSETRTDTAPRHKKSSQVQAAEILRAS